MTSNGMAVEGLVIHPDLEAVAELMNQVWLRPCWRYTAPMLAGYEQRPGAGHALSLGYRCDGELAGYMADMPCPIQYAGQHWRMLFGSFWTAIGKYGIKGVTLKLYWALYQQACLRKYQGLLSIFEEDSRGFRAFERISARLQLSYKTLAHFGMLMGTPRLARRRLPAGRDGGRVQPYTSAWQGQCAALVTRAGLKADLARLFSVAELDYLLGSRAGSRSWIWLEDGRVRGLLGGWSQEILGTRPARGYQFDHVLLDGLEPEEQQAFLGAILADPCWDAIETINLPLTKPVDEALFHQAGFMKTSRSYRLIYQTLHDGPDLEPVDSFYLEFY